MAVKPERTLLGTVTQVTPVLLVRVDGAETVCHADKAVDLAALTVGSRVRMTTRTPTKPLVTAKEVAA